MTDDLSQLPGLLPVMPEIVLALGAMLLLMVGAAVGERSAALVNGLSIVAADRRRAR